ncbi:MAG: hypothetical protein PQJ46_03225 [Spirochaetales bacterium]|nr:hypothetical protein [Spirochaetales bacterium]
MNTRFLKIFIFTLIINILILSTLFARPNYKDQWPSSIFPDNIPEESNINKITETAFIIEDDKDLERTEEYKMVLVFDEKGFLTEEEYFNSDGSNANAIEYKYENGQLVNKIQSYPNAKYSDNEFFETTKDGRILSAKKVFSAGHYGWTYKNTYDNHGRLLLTSKYDRYWSNKLVYSRIFKYDEKGRLSGTEGYGMSSELLWRDVFKYDEDNKIIENIKYNPESEIVVRIINEYDSHGNYVRREFFDRNGSSYAVYSYGWEYDNRGNWTSMIIGREQKGSDSEFIIPDSLVIRDIEYSD